MKNAPDYRGVFLRGFGSIVSNHYNKVKHSSAALGELQGDAIRNIYGEFNDTILANWAKFASGTFKISKNINNGDADYSDFGETYRMIFDASLVVPTGNEIRPINKAVRYFIKAK